VERSRRIPERTGEVLSSKVNSGFCRKRRKEKNQITKDTRSTCEKRSRRRESRKKRRDTVILWCNKMSKYFRSSRISTGILPAQRNLETNRKREKVSNDGREEEGRKE
jgi:hypothetical protein